MVILEIHNRYRIRGGEDVSCDAEVRLLRERGHRVVEYVESNEKVSSLGPFLTACRAIWSSVAYRDVAALIRQEKPDVAIVHNFFPLISPSIFYAFRRGNVPVIQYVRNYRLFCPAAIFFRKGQVCERCVGRWIAWPGVVCRCYRDSVFASLVVAAMVAIHRGLGTWRHQVTRYIAISEFAKRKCVEGGIPPETLSLKPNCVYPDPGAGTGDGGFILFVGRLTPEKGVDSLIAAWRMAGRPAPLKLVGDGPEGTRLRAITAGDRDICWLGELPATQTLDLMGHAAVLAFPSQWYETFGRVAIEAYAKGTPVILSDIGAMSELVDEGITGFRVPPGDAYAWASALSRFFSLDEKTRGMMRQAARTAYEKQYSEERNYGLLMDIIQGVIGKQGRAT